MQSFIYQPGLEGLAISELASSNKQNFLLVVDEESIDHICSQLRFFADKFEILKLRCFDVLPFEKRSPTIELANERLSTLFSILNDSSRKIVITSASAILKKLPPRVSLIKHCIYVKKGLEIDRNHLIHTLVELGYNRFINAAHIGEFAVRGSIIDIISHDSQSGYRIDFFGNKIESIKLFDTATQISYAQVDSFTLHPSTEVITDTDTKSNFAENLRLHFGLSFDYLIEKVNANIKFPGIENLLPLFHESLESIFDYLTPDFTVLTYHNFSEDAKAFLENATYLLNERENFKLKKLEEHSLPALPIEDLYLTLDQIDRSCKRASLIKLSNAQKAPDISLLPNFSIEAQLQKQHSLSLLKEYTYSHSDEKFVISCFTKGSLERIAKLLIEYDLQSLELSCFDEINNLDKRIIGLAILPFEHGFRFKNVNYITEQDILGERLLKKSAASKKSNSKLFYDLGSFNEGDIVVHLEHGIGRFEGLQTLTISNVVHDFIKIGYSDNDKFYLPVENLELLTKYGSGEFVNLDKLGSANWQLRKAKLKNKIKVAAEALLKIAAERSIAVLPHIEPEQELYEQFVNAFPYVETEDQLASIDSVAEDLASGRPMDRLVCGDVGFGKTEVALRAAFMTVASHHNYQVAILVPTTLLSRQHYRTFSTRFADFPFRIKQLSKFTPRSEVKQIKDSLKSGEIDIIIGTHALLAKDIQFKNLGLIIIDEEQHFGVAQKERLKELKSQGHILTLSATPIPRTLQLSLSGIKDLSIIATPPVNRMPIKTFVMPYDAITIREAILREIYRDGRVFYVTPRISYIQGIVDQLKQIVPEAKIISAHGGMSASELDKIMNAFFDGTYSVLISTTIVESGLDIPDANTIIIDRAHYFGLSQLYQIRGRVGRSSNQAFAYITYPDGLKLNSIAQQRLSVLQSIDSLGAGFTIASHDMDLRGHGNLLGDEQSGHVKEVGIELYQHMLEETVRALKDHTYDMPVEEWSPVLHLGIAVHIPEEYIPDIALRISLYRSIANIADQSSLESFAAEMIDRFGPLPDAVHHLFTIIKLKQLSKELHIDKIDAGQKGILFAFKDGSPKHPEKVVEFITRNLMHAKFKDGNKLLVSLDYSKDLSIVKKIETILSALC